MGSKNMSPSFTRRGFGELGIALEHGKGASSGAGCASTGFVVTPSSVGGSCCCQLFPLFLAFTCKKQKFMQNARRVCILQIFAVDLTWDSASHRRKKNCV